MNPPQNNAAVFPLDEDFSWEDLEDAMTGCANWQSANRGKIIPLLFFAPMTAPQNPDAWEPMKGSPQHLFIISIERSSDATLMKALTHAAPALGEVRDAWDCPQLTLDFALPLADVFAKMAAADVSACTLTKLGKDDASFFFIRGPEAVQAFSNGLRWATRSK